MLIVGLSGGIACGKSTVCKILQEVAPDIPIVDQDVIARTVVEVGKPAYQSIVSHFGSEVLLPDKTLNRKHLGNIVFNDASKRRVLSAITRGPIIKETIRQILSHWIAGKTIVIVDSPLLFESGLWKWTHFNVVVWVPSELQLKRLVNRDAAGLEDARARIDSQMPVEKKKDLADYVVDNSGSLDQTREVVLVLVSRLRAERRRRPLVALFDRNTFIFSAIVCMMGITYAYRNYFTST